MRRKLLLLTLLLVVGCCMLVLLWKELEGRPAALSKDPTVEPLAPPQQEFVDDSDVRRPDPQVRQRDTNQAPSLLDDLNDPTRTSENDVRLLATLFGDYASVFKRVPLGMHTEIVAALQGDNPRGIEYIPKGHHSVSPEGEIADRWGKPYFFHVIARNAVEIISAGPDGVLFTDDDVRNAPSHAAVEPDFVMDSRRDEVGGF